MRLSLYAFLVLFCCATTGFSQGFQRLYEVSEQADTTLLHVASTTTSDGATISMFHRVKGSSLVFTFQDTKGKYKEKHEVKLDPEMMNSFSGFNADLTYNASTGLIRYTDIYYTGTEFTSSIIGQLRTDGSDHQCKFIEGITLEDNPESNIYSNIESFIDSRSVLDASDTSVTISMIDDMNELIWSSRYIFRDTFDNTYNSKSMDLKIRDDASIYSVGTVDSSFYMLSIDSTGNVNSSRKYTINGKNSSQQKVILLPNKGFVITGLIGGVNTENYITFLDSTGNIVWSKSLKLNGFDTGIFDIVQSKAGDIIVTGNYAKNDSLVIFASAIDLDGRLKWSTDFGASPTLPGNLNSLNLGKEGMLISYNSKSERGNDAIGLINVMDDGTTLCNDTISAQLTDISIEVDTLIVTRTDGITLGDTLQFKIKEYDKINEPMLIVDPKAKAYCPNEPIMETITAAVSLVDTNNVTYLWNTKETTDSIVVTEEGMYTVTATVLENTCYTLCDTVNLTKTPLPELNIKVDNSTFCEQGYSVLSEMVEGGRPGFSFVWSTGATTPSIRVTESGTYSLTVKDQCQDSSFASISYTLPVNEINSSPVIRDSEFCTTGTVTLIPNVSSTLGDPTKLSYNWSTGASSSTIDVSENGSYSVEVTDNCGDKITVPFTVTLPPRYESKVVDSGVTVDCDNDPDFEYFVTIDGEAVGISWTDDSGSSTESFADKKSIFRTDAKSVTYSIDLGCGNISGTLSAACSCVEFPTIFFPTASGAKDSLDLLDASFGGVFVCGGEFEEVITDYEFKVFNRWGQEVYSATNPTAKWDGKWNSDFVAPDVYVWYARYTENGNTFTKKGNVTVVY